MEDYDNEEDFGDTFEQDHEEEYALNDENNDDLQESFEGGAEEIINKENIIIATTMEIYKPKITRKLMSIYEFVAVITKLADYLFHLDDLSNIIENKEVYSYINHLELAWILLKTGKFNAVINRYIENVSFSELEINPRWIIDIEDNFRTHNEAFESDILKVLKINS